MKKRRVIIAIIIVCIFLGICWGDIIQQNKYEELRAGYEYMEKGNYNQASGIFSEYLESSSNKIYWKMLDICSGKDSIYSYKSVEKALDLCEKNM